MVGRVHFTGAAALILAMEERERERERESLEEATATSAGPKTWSKSASRRRFPAGANFIRPAAGEANHLLLQCVPKFPRKVKYPFSQLYVDGSQNPLTS